MVHAVVLAAVEVVGAVTALMRSMLPLQIQPLQILVEILQIQVVL